VSWIRLDNDIGSRRSKSSPARIRSRHHLCVSFIAHQEGVKYGVPTWVDKQRDEPAPHCPSQGRKNALPGARACQDERGDRRPLEPGRSEGCMCRAIRSATIACSRRRSWSGQRRHVFQLHYSTTGTPMTDKPESVHDRQTAAAPLHPITRSAIGTDGETFRIPPNDANWQSPPAEIFFNEDGQLV